MVNQCTIFYDGKCQFCVAVQKKIQHFDTQDQFLFKDLWKEQPQSNLGITQKQLQEKIHLVTSTGEIHTGYFVFKKIVMGIPKLRLIGLILMIPGFDFLGKIIYKIIAKNRNRTCDRCGEGFNS